MSGARGRWTLPLAGLVAALALAGCGGGGKHLPRLSVARIVEQTIEKTGALKSFHFVLEVDHPPKSTSGLNLTFAEGDVIVPDRLKADVAGTLSGISLRSQVVFVGPRQFIKNPFTGAWQALSTTTKPISFFDPAKGVLAVVKGAIQLSLAGSQTVGGADAYRLTGKVRVRDVTPMLGNPPSDRLVSVELLVGEGDLLLRRVRLDGPVSAEDPASVRRTVAVSKANEKVTIEPPAAG